MSQTYKCDICGEVVTPEEGKLHCTEDIATSNGDMLGFAFFNWQENAARDPEYGHVHKQCVPEMIKRYFLRMKWGRLAFSRNGIVITEEKLAKRKRANGGG